MAEDLLDQFVENTQALRNETRSLTRVQSVPGQRPVDLLDLYDDSRTLLKQIGEVKNQLSKMVDHLEEVETLGVGQQSDAAKDRPATWDSGPEVHRRKVRIKKTGLRIRETLIEIMEEYDDKMDSCRTVMQDLTVTTQIVMSHIARRESELSNSIARATKRDNAQMKSIATLTMVCLPLTSVASIFSMGVFNWNPDAGQRVIGVYFWVYVGVAGGLTALTITTWLWLTSSKKTDGDNSDGRSVASV